MKLSEERKARLASAVDLLKLRIESRGGPASARAAELCAEELRGWVTEAELMRAYRPDVSPLRWVAGDHDRRLDYCDPRVLAEKAGAAVEESESEMVAEREAISRILRRLEAGGGLLMRKVRWVARYHVMQQGERVEVRKHSGYVDCCGQRCEWLTRAVLILRGDVVAKVFPEARAKNMRPAGWRGNKPVLEMRVPELEVSELAMRRISMSVAVLLLRLKRVNAELGSAAAIGRAAGVTRANVSARSVRMQQEDEAESRK